MPKQPTKSLHESERDFERRVSRFSERLKRRLENAQPVEDDPVIDPETGEADRYADTGWAWETGTGWVHHTGYVMKGRPKKDGPPVDFDPLAPAKSADEGGR